jgi:xanthine dehydrogenase YagR molybdenum-binding subunit
MSIPVIGAPRNRVDGPEKVTGGAKYTCDRDLPGLLHAVVVPSAIAAGRVVAIDDAAARRAAGVVLVMTHANAPRVNADKSGPQDAKLFLLQSDVVEFDRQPVAMVVARTFEQAVHGADLVRVNYEARAPQMNLDAGEAFVPQQMLGDQPAAHARGAAEPALEQAHTKIMQLYRTPTEHHNPMETHGTVASWDGESLTLYDSTQWVFGVRTRVAHVFGIDPSNIRVIAPFVGGAFGSKGTAWSHVPLAAMAARATGKPVKLLVTRPQMFGWVGHRPQTEQHVSAGASADGALVAMMHDVRNETSLSDEFIEPCAVFSRDLYAVPHYTMHQELRRLSISKPTYQRAPGESTGGFAVESLMDELAYALAIDPLDLRLRNYSDVDPNNGKEYTSKKLRECYAQASEVFGWSKRTAPPRSMQRNGVLVGWGMATASRGTHRGTADVRIRMNPDGSVLLQSGTIEQGTGSPTVYAQLVAEVLGISYDRVRFEWGDTNLPQAPLAAGSQTAASLGSASVLAAQQLRDRLAALGGKVPADGITLDVHAAVDEEEESRYAQQAFGAHFAEVEVDPDLFSVRVTRFVGAYDVGRVLNAKTAGSQLVGAVVWGISMALFEKTRYDLRTGRIMNATLADYLVPTNADIPNPEVIIVADDDERVNPAGVRGMGEVAMCGSAAAVANAVYHATGVRVRELPITVEAFLA